MTIPETIKVGPFPYRIEYVDDLRDGDDCRMFGQVMYLDKVIRLRTGNSPEQMVSTLLHECLHVIDTQICTLELDEDRVKRLAVALTALLIDNHLLRED